jgi:hypothetical protein
MATILETIQVGTGNKMISVDVHLEDVVLGSFIKCTGVYYVPTFTQNILSAGKLMDSSGTKIEFEGDNLTLSKGGKEIKCPRNPRKKMFYFHSKRKVKSN